MPAIPITRCWGNPLTFQNSHDITSSGFVTTTTQALGACFFTASAAGRTMSALAFKRSVRDMPGLRGKPAVITTTSEPATADRSLAPMSRPPRCHSGAACCRSSAFPCGMPSTMSTSVTSASPRSAM